jgi:hypothetical protein
LKRSLVPVLVRQCSAEKLLKPIIYIDLIGLNEEPAEKRLMEGIKGKRAKPGRKPNFPGIADVPTERERPKFPGYSAPEGPRTSVHIPKLQRPPFGFRKASVHRTSVPVDCRILPQHVEGTDTAE